MVFLTGNILLFPKLGGVQTIVLPVLGQILMGLTIDNFGLFYSQQTSLTAFRIAGAVLVLLGVVLVSTAKESKADRTNRQKAAPASLWLWRAFSVFSGMAVATQTAVNGYLGVAAGSPIKASVISFAVGIILLAIICIVLRLKNGKPESKEERPAKKPLVDVDWRNPWRTIRSRKRLSVENHRNWNDGCRSFGRLHDGRHSGRSFRDIRVSEKGS